MLTKIAFAVMLITFIIGLVLLLTAAIKKDLGGSNEKTVHEKEGRKGS
jgi:hypothetical protein